MTHARQPSHHEPQGSVRRGMERMDAEEKADQERAISAEFWRTKATQLAGRSAILEVALKEIRDQDYRGNRPWSATRAYEALKDVGIE